MGLLNCSSAIARPRAPICSRNASSCASATIAAGKFDRVFGFDVHAKAVVRALVPELLAFARIDDGFPAQR